MPNNLQPTYGETMRKGLPGMPATMTGWDADTRQVETAAGIGFGLAVSQGTGDKGVLLGGASAAVFVGITYRDVTQVVGNADKYAQYGDAAVMIRGDIWMTAPSGGVAKGADATFNSTTGVVGSAAASGSQFAIAGARWMTTAAAGELAILRLSGHLPSA